MPIRISIPRNPPQRYWRRRANRRVRKARLARDLWRGLRSCSGQGLLLLLVSFAVWRSYAGLARGGEFALEQIEVEGSQRVSADAVRERLRPFVGGNLLDLDLGQVAATAALDPWILWLGVKRLLPHTLRLTVTERTPCALALIDGRIQLIDAEGHVVGPPEPGFPYGLPVVTGLERLEDRDGALRRGAALVQQLREIAEPWIDEVSELDLSQADRVAVRTVDPGPTVLLDPDDVTRNVVRFLALRREIAQRVGDVEYVDLRWRDRISVMPVTKLLEGG